MGNHKPDEIKRTRNSSSRCRQHYLHYFMVLCDKSPNSISKDIGMRQMNEDYVAILRHKKNLQLEA